MTQYRKAIPYFTKAYTIDPENIHNLNKRAITYYIIQEYDEVLSDLDKIIQLDPLNSSAYYLKSLTYYTKNDNNNAKVSFKKCAELYNSYNILAKIQLFHLEYLLNKNSSKDLNNVLTKINKLTKIYQTLNYYYDVYENELLQFIKCKIHIELKEYSEAKLALDHIPYYAFESNNYFIQEHPDFWSYLYKVNVIDKNDFTKFGIVDEFSKYMYKKHEVYFVSNLTNLNSELFQFQESDISSLSGLVMSSKNENLHLVLPILKNCHYFNDYLICKINVKKILSKDCFIKFIPDDNYQEDYMLKHKDVSKLEGLGWIEYQTCIHIHSYFQLSIVINSIEMQMEYIRFGYNVDTITRFPNMSLVGYLLSDYNKFISNVPETFKNKYFSRKEMENLFDLKDILNSL
ncbi:hypothetical protein GLOIN_2v1837326 [Rhizophagus irregularis DAOM 181602=DAOM 197198]|uniref:Uncharacterized protein n=3 Tax=Rhizophagus irregularis TaxID=588596 RepID=A0A015J3X1_RHIIW|nr:hypothetical protein GLOIN_2v1837326 [Rhizophagus irregularis DAOM 181602=DAOM 197198]EXX64152.1 hypothetical protein RirG_145580 [Rhizophagus irregularis DAOM 197198w]POG77848.1 hypothetical protein GLOIN_2v1837326 [Rhizophagus irregularis DAOM 181602=DAOM 197198]|eukprot:XP_025184714.1 hypothetical protein GLOIN_2v1837326 [Rhizophagus irregularis DAOM 181602=DAOM 197198]